MGSICEEYEVAPLRAPNNPKNNKSIIKGRKNYIIIKKQSYKATKEIYKKSLIKIIIIKTPYKNLKLISDIKYFKCTRFKYYSNKCSIKEKIQ